MLPKDKESMPTLEFLAVDRLATGAVMPGEVTALEHELGNHTVECGTLIAKPVLAGRELAKVFCGFGDDAIIQLEDYSTSWGTVDGDVKLPRKNKYKHP